MACKECNKRGKTWRGDDPKCGFETDVFSPENWNCASIGLLRDLADERSVYNEGQYCSIIPIPDTCEFIVLSWYKNRGRTDYAIVMSDTGPRPLTIDVVESILNTSSNSAMDAIAGRCTKL
jgi:hypothetical protein